jgi:serpin B
MWLLVPDAGQFSDVTSTLDGERLRAILSEAESNLVYLRMPRWEIEQDFSLAEKLEALGMGPAFDPNTADFSGMDGGSNLFISDVVHKSFVKVDEAGTEAAAATAVIMEATAMQEEPVPVELTVDRPFLFFIYDRPTETILFFGQVVDPLSK